MAHFVYILKSLKDSRFYIGSTHNIQKRLDFHNAGLQRSTRNRIPFILVYVDGNHEEPKGVLQQTEK